MRNQNSFALPIEFTWKRARAGYQWLDTDRGRLLCAVNALQPDWQNSFERYETTYQPRRNARGCSANSPRSSRASNRFSHLPIASGCWASVAIASSSLGMVAYRYTVSFSELWKEEIEAFKLALEAWDAVAAGSRQALAELKAKLGAPQLPLAVQRALHLDDRIPPGLRCRWFRDLQTRDCAGMSKPDSLSRQPSSTQRLFDADDSARRPVAAVRCGGGWA